MVLVHRRLDAVRDLDASKDAHRTPAMATGRGGGAVCSDRDRLRWSNSSLHSARTDLYVSGNGILDASREDRWRCASSSGEVLFPVLFSSNNIFNVLLLTSIIL